MACISMEANFSSNGKFTLESTSVTYDISVVNGEVILKLFACGIHMVNGTWSIDESLTQLFLEFIIDNKSEKLPFTGEIEISGNKLAMKDLFYKVVGPKRYYMQLNSKEFNNIQGLLI